MTGSVIGRFRRSTKVLEDLISPIVLENHRPRLTRPEVKTTLDTEELRRTNLNFEAYTFRKEKDSDGGIYTPVDHSIFHIVNNIQVGLKCFSK